jgi:PmbA protein
VTAQDELLASARAAIALAKKHGVSDASATATRDRDVSVTWRDGKLEAVSDATSRSMSLALYVDGKYGAMSTNDLRADALDRFVRDAVALVRSLARDPFRKLPDPALYAGRTEEDLAIFDPAIEALTMDDRVGRARALEAGARGAKGADRILSVTTSVADGIGAFARVTTNGFEGAYRYSNVSTSASVSVKDDDRRPEDDAYAATRFLADLPDEALVGREATERATARLGTKKIASGTMPLLVEPRAARTLWRHLMSATMGGAVQQKESFLEGKLGARVASPSVTLIEDPLAKRGLASRPFDAEGMATRARPIIEKGVLKSYYLDVYYAAKLASAPTTGRPTNVTIPPGTKSLGKLMGEMKDGILVTSFLGGNSNTTTGAFSLGLNGFHIVKGERREPVSEMNLSGVHTDFWKRLVALGDDPYRWSSLRSPSLLFDGVSVAGK